MTTINYADTDIIHGLTEKHLTDISLNGHLYKVTEDTGAAFIRMREDALKDGINLCIASSFRNFGRQKVIFEEKIAGVRPVLDRGEHPVNILELTPEELIRTIMFFSAVPGMSRHHWGTDLDVYDPDALADGEDLDLTNRCYSQGCQKEVGTWLGENMHRYGFFRPYALDNPYYSYELWHISHYAEADLFTGNLNPQESIVFLREKAGLSLPDTVADIIEKEFNQRFRLFSHDRRK